jgi:hypothetical protein
MKLKDRLIVKHKDTVIDELVYMASVQTQHLFSKPENIVGPDQKAILWCGDVGTTSMIPIKTKHNFIQLEEGLWELDVEPIEKGDL